MDYFDSRGLKYQKEVDTAKVSSIRTGGVARLAVYPKTAEAFFELISFLHKTGERYKIVGRCTNMYFSDNGFNGVLVFTSALDRISMGDGFIYAECGAGLGALCRRALKVGYDLSASLSGIPGSVGGAVRMNAGAFGSAISDILTEADVYDADNDKTVRMSQEDLDFKYRHSVIQEGNLFVLGAKFKVKSAPKSEILEKIIDFSMKRRACQPSLPSLGSFFKAFDDVSASKLIDDAGLKGFSIGGASVSEKHAGFIVNNGGATSSDVNSLAEIVEEKVFGKYSRRLIREVEFCE